MRRLIVGVIGGDENVERSEAFAVGAAIAEAGLILCTGGHPNRGPAVKNASMYGAVSATPEARTIGILPLGDRPFSQSHQFQFYVQTHLPSTGRNAFTGLTPDAMIVFPGSRGTLTEMAFAWMKRTPVWLWRSRDFLWAKRRWHETQRDHRGTVLDQMNDALAILPSGLKQVYSVDSLDTALEEALDQAPIADGNPEELIRSIIERLGGTSTDYETGYPGRRDEPTNKAWFDSEVVRISGSVHHGLE